MSSSLSSSSSFSKVFVSGGGAVVPLLSFLEDPDLLSLNGTCKITRGALASKRSGMKEFWAAKRKVIMPKTRYKMPKSARCYGLSDRMMRYKMRYHHLEQKVKCASRAESEARLEWLDVNLTLESAPLISPRRLVKLHAKQAAASAKLTETSSQYDDAEDAFNKFKYTIVHPRVGMPIRVCVGCQSDLTGKLMIDKKESGMCCDYECNHQAFVCNLCAEGVDATTLRLKKGAYLYTNCKKMQEEKDNMQPT
jgi:hypothetical protein